jgi:hypothetical protein
MSTEELVRSAFEAFAGDVAVPPPLTLRGGNAVDGYQRPEPFDSAHDQPTDAYVEGFAFWGLGYLDAQSWRHYLPRLIEYSLRRPDDPAMVAEALVRSLRPPDRYPPRLASLSREQETLVAAFLEHVARDEASTGVREEARQALDEWWGPAPRSRPTHEEIESARQAPATLRLRDGDGYRLGIPETLAGSGVRDIPEESRRVETWGGYLRGDAYTVIAVNVSPLEVRSMAEAVVMRSGLFRDPVRPVPADVPGARHALRLDGQTDGDSPAEPHTLTLVLAEDGRSLVTLSIRAWPRDDVAQDVAAIINSFQLLR